MIVSWLRGGLTQELRHAGGSHRNNHRLQHLFPSIGTVDIAFTQGAAYKVAKLVEVEQQVKPHAAEVTISDRALPVAGLCGATSCPFFLSNDSACLYRDDGTLRQRLPRGIVQRNAGEQHDMIRQFRHACPGEVVISGQRARFGS